MSQRNKIPDILTAHIGMQKEQGLFSLDITTSVSHNKSTNLSLSVSDWSMNRSSTLTWEPNQNAPIKTNENHYRDGENVLIIYWLISLE